MDFALSYNNAEELLWFPVVPNEGISVKYQQNNSEFDGISGTLRTIGTPGLRTFSLESFFPLHEYSFTRPNARLFKSNGWYYVGMIERGLAAKVPFRAQYFDNNFKAIFNFPVTIDSFEHWITQAGDIGYRLDFTEYRFSSLSAGELASQSASGGSATTGLSDVIVNGNTGVQTDAQAQQSASQGYAVLFSQSDATILAKTMWCESRGIRSQTEIACVGWTVCNRVDDNQFPSTISAVITQQNQFYYTPDAKTVSDYGYDLVELATDVLIRWCKERAGQQNVGRVLPSKYRWFAGSAGHNWFYPSYPMKTSQRWDYSLPSPYDN